MIKAVVFDLDDTLYPEYDYVLSCFGAVSEHIQQLYGIADAKSELTELFAQSREHVFDRFAQSHGLDKSCVVQMVEVYRTHTPDIKLSDEVKQTLKDLRSHGYKLGIITDGRPNGQRAKIEALGLNSLVDEIIITDELGGEQYRKPNPKAFKVMANRLGVAPSEMLYVGDNPQKDFAVKKFLPVKTAILKRHNGLYTDKEYLYGILPDVVMFDISNTLSLSEETL